MISGTEDKLIVGARSENISLAIKYAILSNLLFVMSSISIKYYVEIQSYPPTFEFAIYQQIGVAVTAYLCIKYLGNHVKDFKKEEHLEMWMVIRVFLLFFGTALVVIAFSNVKPSWITVIISMNPIFINLLSTIILKQRFIISYIYYCIIAFGGVVIMINGSSEADVQLVAVGHDKSMILGIVASTIFSLTIAILDISMIKLTETFDAFSLNFYCSIYAAAFGFLFLIFSYGPLSVFQYTNLSLVIFGNLNGFFIGLSLFFLNLAFQQADVSRTSYLSYLQVPLVTGLSYLLFGDLINLLELLGIIIIMSSVSYASIYAKA